MSSNLHNYIQIDEISENAYTHTKTKCILYLCFVHRNKDSEERQEDCQINHTNWMRDDNVISQSQFMHISQNFLSFVRTFHCVLLWKCQRTQERVNTKWLQTWQLQIICPVWGGFYYFLMPTIFMHLYPWNINFSLRKKTTPIVSMLCNQLNFTLNK